MNTTAEDRRTGHATLWDRVRDWFATWTAIFAPDEILRDGLSRRFALRCSNWLWPLEAAARRLIIAAALALGPADLAHASQHRPPRKPGKPTPAHPANTSFRIVSMRGAGASRTAADIARIVVRPARHLPFPSDDLLRLGAPRGPGARKIVVRYDHPLQRHGRIRPSDPDYLPRSECDYANCSKHLFGSPEDRKPPPVRPPSAERSLYFHVPSESDDSEWRRIEKEWNRELPAPGIAMRIVALGSALETPEPYIQRLARRLARDPGLAALLRAAPPPALRKPKYDPHGPHVDEDLALLAHAEIPPDTS